MSNMSYCRFYNTSSDMGDCVDTLERALEEKEGENLASFKTSLSSEEERRALDSLYEHAQRFIELYDELEERE